MASKYSSFKLPRSRKEFEQRLEAAKFASLAEFAAGAGHDLNNPLAAILGRAQMLLAQETDAGKRAELAAICANVHRAQEMIFDLRLVAQAPAPEFRKIFLADLLEDIPRRFTHAFSQQEIVWEVTVSLPPEVWECSPRVELEADPVQMQVLFRALVQNSLRAIGHGGAIRVAVSVPQPPEMLEIRVSDTGHGVPEDIRGMIFDPFFSSYQSGRGLGFGLTKARQIARMHGGDVIFEETTAETTFLVTLPMKLPQEQQPGA